jgi:hypothetical protein
MHPKVRLYWLRSASRKRSCQKHARFYNRGSNGLRPNYLPHYTNEDAILLASYFFLLFIRSDWRLFCCAKRWRHLNSSQIPVASGVQQITGITHAGGGPERIFILTRYGQIWVRKNGRALEEPFLDISSRVATSTIEQGTLAAFYWPQSARPGHPAAGHPDVFVAWAGP